MAAVLTVPYTYADEIEVLAPALDRWFNRPVPLGDVDRVGLLQILHLGALVVLGWAALGLRGRSWLARDFVPWAVPVVRKVGTQSLAVFMASNFLARLDGWVLDTLGRDAWHVAAVKLAGFATLIGVAYLVSWFKSEPWHVQRPEAVRQLVKGAADARGRPRMAAMRA